MIDRVVLALNGQPIQRRVGYGHFADEYYLATMEKVRAPAERSVLAWTKSANRRKAVSAPDASGSTLDSGCKIVASKWASLKPPSLRIWESHSQVIRPSKPGG